MSNFLDWIILNSWAVALTAVIAAIAGYAITRPAALRGASSDDPNAWLVFCTGLYPDTRADQNGDDTQCSDGGDSFSDAGD